MGGDSDRRSGRRLLSKMVQFVTKPTTPWSRLDGPPGEADGARTQARLKGLIERKRQDDAVRARELDMLRGLLRRNAPGAAAGLRMPAHEQAARAAAERERTLEKINELDAQMTGPGPQPQASWSPPTAGDEAAATAVAVAANSQPGGCKGVEEAAIHFANGDAGEAEAALLQLLASPGPDHADSAQPWLMLLDLYRLTQQRDRFDDLGARFAQRFQRAAPRWTHQGGSAPQAAAPAAWPDADEWRAPAQLDAASWAQAELVLLPQADDGVPRPADWRAVEQLAPQVLPALTAALQRWAARAASLSWRGVDQLLHVLAARTVLYDGAADADWWRARLALLQLLDEPQAFDEAALGFCLTYELAPPPWQAPVCRVDRPDAPARPTAAAQEAPDSAFTPTVFMGDAATDTLDDGVYRLALDGELQGQADVLPGKLVLPAGTQFVECDCRRLRRVDFGAASALYNWVANEQGRGCHVIFVDVNHLVAAFLDVIGMNDITAVIRAED